MRKSGDIGLLLSQGTRKENDEESVDSMSETEREELRHKLEASFGPEEIRAKMAEGRRRRSKAAKVNRRTSSIGSLSEGGESDIDSVFSLGSTVVRTARRRVTNQGPYSFSIYCIILTARFGWVSSIDGTEISICKTWQRTSLRASISLVPVHMH